MKFNMFNIKGLFLFLAFFFVSNVLAQVTTPLPNAPYFSGFETAQERAGWSLINGTNPNAWTFGNAIYATGLSSSDQSALYISRDGGLTAGHNATSGYVGAYKDFQLSAGSRYRFSFEWLNPGTEGEMYVFLWFNPATAGIADATLTGTSVLSQLPYFESLPSMLRIFRQPWVEGDSIMRQSPNWAPASFDYSPPSDRIARLAFVWISNKSNQPGMPGGAIDNVQVGVVNCGVEALNNLNYRYNINTDRGEFTWNAGSVGALYDLRYYPTSDPSNVVEVSDLTEPRYSMPELTPGTYKIWTRVRCGNNVSSWKISYIRIYSRLTGCFDYTDFRTDHVVVTWGPFWGTDNHRTNLFLNERIEDFGAESAHSRITVHHDKNEIDAISGLPTIPPGYEASVRLGRAVTGSGGDGNTITYDYFVNKETALVLINYAIILENANVGGASIPHACDMQPDFAIQILDENGIPITDACGVELLTVGCPPDPIWQRGQGLWEYVPWQSFGYNLEPFIGRTLKIRIMVNGCGHGGHGGYTYFTLGCMSYEIQGQICYENIDEIPSQLQPLEAPAGFKAYRWQVRAGADVNNNSKTISTNRIFTPLDEDEEYVCFIFYGQNNCHFALYGSAAPRRVRSLFEPTIRYENCSAIVTLSNKSYTETPGGRRGEPDTFLWTFPDGSTSEIQSPAPLVFTEAGTYTVSLRAGILLDKCTATYSVQIEIPEFANTEETQIVNVCEDDLPFVYNFNGVDQFFTASEILTFNHRSIIGDCDSIVNIDLRVHQKYFEEKYILCQNLEESYYWNGEYLTESGDYTKSLVNIHGCDSIVTLSLRVFGALIVELADIQEICHGDVDFFELDYTILSADFTSYSVEFDERAKANGFTDRSAVPRPPIISPVRIDIPQQAMPNTYTGNLIFFDENIDCTEIPFSLEIPFSVTISYPTDIVSQRWNNLLFLHNRQYNGGYDFFAYQWYKNNEPIFGATKSYLNIAEGLDMSAEYRAAITRVGDDFSVFTCPISPYWVENVTLTLVSNVTHVGGSFQFKSSESGRAFIYSLDGILISEQPIHEGENQLKAPLRAGYYLLKITMDDQQTKTYQVYVM
jgi:hypothetical protein